MGLAQLEADTRLQAHRQSKHIFTGIKATEDVTYSGFSANERDGGWWWDLFTPCRRSSRLML